MTDHWVCVFGRLGTNLLSRQNLTVGLCLFSEVRPEQSFSQDPWHKRKRITVYLKKINLLVRGTIIGDGWTKKDNCPQLPPLISITLTNTLDMSINTDLTFASQYHTSSSHLSLPPPESSAIIGVSANYQT